MKILTIGLPHICSAAPPQSSPPYEDPPDCTPGAARAPRTPIPAARGWHRPVRGVPPPGRSLARAPRCCAAAGSGPEAKQKSTEDLEKTMKSLKKHETTMKNAVQTPEIGEPKQPPHWPKPSSSSAPARPTQRKAPPHAGALWPLLKPAGPAELISALKSQCFEAADTQNSPKRTI